METVKNAMQGELFERPSIYRDQLLILEDLQDFKRQLIIEIRSLLKEQNGQPSKKWLKSKDVLKILGISSGTLQTLRNKGTLPFTRVGGVIYYDADDINELLESNKRSKNTH
jgi:hypothetical protein